MTANCILERVHETRSTNDDLLERWRLGELIDPVSRIAQNQTAGKGRAGRAWIANPKDSLCFSLAYPFKRTPSELSGLSLLVGLAVIHGIAQACNLNQTQLQRAGLRLKWPNDILLNGTKLGGILIEGGQAKAGDPTWMIIGIGINLRNEAGIESSLSTGLKAGSLAQLTNAVPDVECLWLKCIASLENYLAEFDLRGFQPWRDQWMEWDAYQEQSIFISGGGREPIYGIAKGIDETGALLLQQENNTVCIHAGDVSLRTQS